MANSRENNSFTARLIKKKTRRNERTVDLILCLLDPRLMFNFIDSNTDARLSYLEFRSWMLMIDQTLAEHEVFQIFTEVDRNRICVCFSSH